MSLIKYKEIDVHYRKVGSGPALVFLHGFLEDHTIWTNLLPDLSSHFTCFTIDLLGHGRTGCLGYIHHMEEMADAVSFVLKKHNFDSCHLLGHSMGGYVALALLQQGKQKIKSIVLLNSTSQEDSEERRLNRTRAIQIVKSQPKAYASMAIANLFAEKNRERLKEEILSLKDIAIQTPLQGIIAALEGMKIRKDYSQLLSDFKGKKIIIAGDQDPVIPVQNSIQEARNLKVAIEVVNSGHMTFLENPKDLQITLQTFYANFSK